MVHPSDGIRPQDIELAIATIEKALERCNALKGDTTFEGRLARSRVIIDVQMLRVPLRFRKPLLAMLNDLISRLETGRESTFTIEDFKNAIAQTVQNQG